MRRKRTQTFHMVTGSLLLLLLSGIVASYGFSQAQKPLLSESVLETEMHSSVSKEDANGNTYTDYASSLSSFFYDSAIESARTSCFENCELIPDLLAEQKIGCMRKCDAIKALSIKPIPPIKYYSYSSRKPFLSIGNTGQRSSSQWLKAQHNYSTPWLYNKYRFSSLPGGNVDEKDDVDREDSEKIMEMIRKEEQEPGDATGGFGEVDEEFVRVLDEMRQKWESKQVPGIGTEEDDHREKEEEKKEAGARASSSSVIAEVKQPEEEKKEKEKEKEQPRPIVPVTVIVPEKLGCYASDGTWTTDRKDCDPDQAQQIEKARGGEATPTPEKPVITPPVVEDAVPPQVVRVRIEQKFVDRGDSQRKQAELLSTMIAARQRMDIVQSYKALPEEVRRIVDETTEWLRLKFAETSERELTSGEISTIASDLKEKFVVMEGALRQAEGEARKQGESIVATDEQAREGLTDITKKLSLIIDRIPAAFGIVKRDGIGVPAPAMESFAQAQAEMQLLKSGCQGDTAPCKEQLSRVIASLERVQVHIEKVVKASGKMGVLQEVEKLFEMQ